MSKKVSMSKIAKVLVFGIWYLYASSNAIATECTYNYPDDKYSHDKDCAARYGYAPGAKTYCLESGICVECRVGRSFDCLPNQLCSNGICLPQSTPGIPTFPEPAPTPYNPPSPASPSPAPYKSSSNTTVRDATLYGGLATVGIMLGAVIFSKYYRDSNSSTPPADIEVSDISSAETDSNV